MPALQQFKSANTLLKCARRFGGACTMLSYASLRDVSRMIETGKEVLVECGDAYFFVTAIDDGTVTLREIQSDAPSMMSVAQFARMWYIERGDVRFGRMIVIEPRSL
jgi:hypothetical protein